MTKSQTIRIEYSKMPASSAFSPVPSSQGKGSTHNHSAIHNAAPVLSKDYLEAVSVLNEDTMNRACQLLMKAYDSDNNTDADTESITLTSTQTSKKQGTISISNSIIHNEAPVEDQLLEMYYKCQESLTVIRKHKQQPLHPPLGSAGSSSGSLPGKGNNATKHKKGKNLHHMMLPPGAPSLNGLKKRTVMTSKHGIHPSHKTTSSVIGLGVGALKQKGMMSMKRMSSLNINALNSTNTFNKATLNSTSISSTTAAHGKAMLSGRGRSTSPPQSFSRGEDSASASAPPPSVLSFLAKLNRDPGVGDFNVNDDDNATENENNEVIDEKEKESTERCSKKHKKKKKRKSNERENENECDDSDRKEEVAKEAEDKNHENHRKRRRHHSKDIGDGNDNINDCPSPKRKRRGDNVLKNRPVIEDGDEDDADDPNEAEVKESSPPSSNEDDEDDDDGDTSADETYHGRSETSPSKRTSFSRKAKPDAETLTGNRGGKYSPTKGRKSRNRNRETNPKSNAEEHEDISDGGRNSPPKRRKPRNRDRDPKSTPTAEGHEESSEEEQDSQPKRRKLRNREESSEGDGDGSRTSSSRRQNPRRRSTSNAEEHEGNSDGSPSKRRSPRRRSQSNTEEHEENSDGDDAKTSSSRRRSPRRRSQSNADEEEESSDGSPSRRRNPRRGSSRS